MNRIEQATREIKSHLFDQQVDLLVCNIIMQSLMLNIMRNAGDDQRIVNGLRRQAMQAMGALELNRMPPRGAEALRTEAARRVEQWFLDLERTAELQPAPEKMS